jgi:phage shock protein PspC (stress-responsive transcriptional regulator)
MSSEGLFESIKENLNGRPGQPIVLGVCKSLATRFDKEVWIFRAAAIFFGVFWTIPTLIAYVLAGWFMPETEERTRGVFRGLFLWLNECCEKAIDAIRGVFDQPSHHRGSKA